MKREEALEYMNRYLDHDLDAQETEQLLRHLGDSPEAQADFDFLQSLSDKLESLPDVKPPISLVDSILPRLNEIDIAASAAAPEPEKLSEMESKRMFGEEAPARRRASSFWRSTLGRAVGGTSVAVAVLGIFVATYEPQQMPNAEITSSTAVSGALDDTLVPSSDSGQTTNSEGLPDVTDPSTEVEPIEPEATLKAEDDVMAQRSTVPEDGAAQEPAQPEDPAEPSTDVPAAGDSPQASTRSAEDGSAANDAAPSGGAKTPSEAPPVQSSPSGTAQDRSDDAAANTEYKNKHSKEPVPQDKAPKGNAKDKPKDKPQDKPKENAAAANEGQSANDSISASEAPTGEDPAAAGSADEETQPNEGMGTFSPKDRVPSDPEGTESSESTSADAAPPEVADSRIFGLTAVASEWVSPNNAYLVTYSQNTLKLLKGDRSIELGSRKVDGSVAGGVWSADGRTFTYDLIKPDGTSAQGTWKVEDAKPETGSK